MRAVLGHEITRSRKTAAEPIGVRYKAPKELTLPTSSKPDPRLIAWSGYSRGKPRETSFKPHGMAKRGAASRIKEGC